MTTLHELAQTPLHEMTLRVQLADTPEAKLHEFGNWMLKVNGIIGAHGVDAVNQVIHEEFGPETSITAGQLAEIQHYFGPRYFVKKNGEIHMSAI